LFDFDDIITGALRDPERVWRYLDSFWRTRTTPTTHDLVLFETYAQTLLELNVLAKSDHFIRAQTVPVIEDFLRVPWYPVILFQDRLIDQSLVLYGEGYIYDPLPEIVYGQQGLPRFLYPMAEPLVAVSEICDAITNTSVVLDATQFAYDVIQQRFIFSVDPFTLIPAKTDAGSGRQYIVLWLRNPQFDMGVPFDWAGWVAKYERSGENYAATLQMIWELILLGPSVARYQDGLLRAAGLPYVSDGEEVVRRVENDGFRNLISTDTKVYGAPLSVVPVVAPGDVVTRGTPLTDGIRFMDYQGVLASTDATLPGLLLKVPLSTGVIAELSFANVTDAWTYDALRPSPWRFPVGGDPTSVEQFWVDVDTFATANGIDFQTLYGLPAAVNPMKRIVEDLLQNSLYVASLRLSEMPDVFGGFSDRARLLLPGDVLIVLQQFLDSVSDSFDLGSETSDTVGYGYHAAVPTEIISVPGNGTDLTYYDYTPLVVTT
jgi:hypothetical protein